MHKIRFWGETLTRPHWGSLQRSPTASSLILGVLLLREKKGKKANKKPSYH